MYPMQNGFVKQVRLSGKEKAAILLGELGYTTETLCKYFSDSELKKIKRGFASLGGQYNVNLENSVLEETCAFGISRNLLPPDAIARAQHNAEAAAAQYAASSRLGGADLLANNGLKAQDLANVLSMWLKEE
ncbi:hypothetical protein [Treponema sp.]|uniref:hypothetical protein n=1 Tax=Treponema sp. TaxID=166 RepID=UPI00298E4FC2|nr:hypothetical protein [Treponema sp.]MCQ2241316.1 hypothetical protein [Treponema sp.]